ncbi:hypothetical protein ABIE76_004473 [Sinorhizobium fredii]
MTLQKVKVHIEEVAFLASFAFIAAAVADLL